MRGAYWYCIFFFTKCHLWNTLAYMYTVVTRMRWLKRAAFPFTKATNSFWKKLAILLYFSSPVLRACAAHFQALWPLLLLTGARIQEILLAVGAASSSPPRHIYLCKYITSTSTSSEVWTYTECLVWFGLAIDQWELRWLSTNEKRAYKSWQK